MRVRALTLLYLPYQNEYNVDFIGISTLTGVKNQVDLTNEREAQRVLEHGRRMSPLVGYAQTNLDIVLRRVQVLVNLGEAAIHIPQQNHAKGCSCTQHSYTKEKNYQS